jgi:hypothetical protein
MQRAILLIAVLSISFISCKKDKDSFATGTVTVKGSCFDDAWLIAIDNADPGKHKFLRASTIPTATFYNCSNAVYIRLPSTLAVSGTKIRFTWIATEASCLSYSEAPNHIQVKNLAKR